MQKKLLVIIKDKHQQYEGLRSSLGALLEISDVEMVVLDHEIEMHDAYKENMEFFDEMEGKRYSNNKANIEKYGFLPITLEELAEKVKKADIVIPF